MCGKTFQSGFSLKITELQDGCVYTKAGAANEEFCFQSAVLSADTEVTCDPSTERNVPISSTPLLIGKASQKNFKIFSIN